MTDAEFRAKLEKLVSERDQAIKAEAKKPQKAAKSEPKAPKVKVAKAQPKAEEKAEVPAEPVIVPFTKDFRLEAELQPEGLVGKKSPRAKFQAEGLDLGTEGTEGKIYAYFPVGKEIPKSLVATFGGESRGKKAIYKAETKDGIAVFVYLPIRHIKSSKLDLDFENTEGGLKVTAVKHRNGASAQPEAEKETPAVEPEAPAPKPKASRRRRKVASKAS